MKRIIPLTFCLLLFLGMFAFSAQALSVDLGHFNSIAEYDALLKKSRVPSGYIDARSLSLLGDPVYGLVQAPNWDAYYYLYSTGISISISHTRKTLIYSDPPLYPLPDDTSNMRQIAPLSNGESFSYFRSGMYYGYSGNGTLACIEWFANDIYFRLSIDAQALRSRNPLLERLLSPSDETATAAFQELCDAAGLIPLKIPLWETQARADRTVGGFLITFIIITFFVSYLLEKARHSRKAVTRNPRSTNMEEISISTFVNHESPFDTPNAH